MPLDIEPPRELKAAPDAKMNVRFLGVLTAVHLFWKWFFVCLI